MNQSTQHFKYLSETANAVFGTEGRYENYRLPVLKGNNRTVTKTAKAVWTSDFLQPRWNNLAILIDEISTKGEFEEYKKLIKQLPIHSVALSHEGNFYLLQSQSNSLTNQKVFGRDDLGEWLAKFKDELFSPKALRRFKTGQLSFSDIEDFVTPNSFTMLSRHRAVLDKNLEKTLKNAHHCETEHRLKQYEHTISEEKRLQIELDSYENVLSVTFAYLAARILEDKGYFGDSLPTNNPARLLTKTVDKTNGFFKKALYDNLPKISVETAGEISSNLGASISFSLIDHYDVGRLYEKASVVFDSYLRQLINDSTKFESDNQSNLVNLQRHYTPFSVAEKILESLPLEKLRPEERVVIDLAAGSGTLLSAATLRLNSMIDISTDDQREYYLKNNIIGNDKDYLASLITKLRYLLINQCLVGKDQSFFLPQPTLENKDYNTFTKNTLPGKPRVWVANPPYSLEIKQIAFNFVTMVTDWMREGDQFAFILPSTFLNGQVQGAKQAREALNEKAQILETWQLPEKSVGISAEQPVCVVIGEITRSKNTFSISRGVHSRQKVRSKIIERGYLGRSWLSQIPQDSAPWYDSVSKTIKLTAPTIKFNKLYFSFVGIEYKPEFPPIPEQIPGIDCKPFWQIGWRKGGIWANPQDIDSNKRFIRYEKNFMNSMREQNENLFEKEKIIIAHTMNRDTSDNLAAHYDDNGFFPDLSAYCICTRTSANKTVGSEFSEWHNLSENQRLMWLLGIFMTKTARNLLYPYRTSRQLRSDALNNFPLPETIDENIIQLVEKIIEIEKLYGKNQIQDKLKIELEKIVRNSYKLSAYEVKAVVSNDNNEIEERDKERSITSVIITGQVLDFNVRRNKIKLYLSGILDDVKEDWITLPSEMPGWALEGNVFTADLSSDISEFKDLSKRVWAMRNFKHTPRPYLTAQELENKFFRTTDQNQ